MNQVIEIMLKTIATPAIFVMHQLWHLSIGPSVYIQCCHGQLILDEINLPLPHVAETLSLHVIQG